MKKVEFNVKGKLSMWKKCMRIITNHHHYKVEGSWEVYGGTKKIRKLRDIQLIKMWKIGKNKQ